MQFKGDIGDGPTLLQIAKMFHSSFLCSIKERYCLFGCCQLYYQFCVEVN